jgi:galactokinase/mevalonate kinase-like predicted kinase
MRTTKDLDLLVSLPASSVKSFEKLTPNLAKNCFAASDPIGTQLGSGGGTAYLLLEAWRNQSPQSPFFDWLNKSNKLMIHGSGQSRRLPAYAASGKSLAPLPIMDGFSGQVPGQTLLDFQKNTYGRFYMNASNNFVLMIACGDVMVISEKYLPMIPDADIAIFGMPTTPEEATNHGALFCPLSNKQNVDFFLQKPDVERTRKLQQTHLCYLDTGIWLFSEKAVKALFNKCGLKDIADLTSKIPDMFDIYSDMGVCLGTNPDKEDKELNELTTAIVPMQNTRFLHFGTNQSLISSTLWLAQYGLSRTDQFNKNLSNFRVIQYSNIEQELSSQKKQLWIDNSSINKTWKLNSNHVITSIPENKWSLALKSGICLDCSYVSDNSFALRFYGYNDMFKGELSSDCTTFCSISFSKWLKNHGLSLEELQLDAHADIQTAKLFPSMQITDLDDSSKSDFINWLINPSSKENDKFKKMYIESERYSASDLLYKSELDMFAKQRSKSKKLYINDIINNDEFSRTISKLDLKQLANMLDDSQVKSLKNLKIRDEEFSNIHYNMLLSLLTKEDSEKYQAKAFEQLREVIIGNAKQSLSQPTRNVKEDQLVWGRSPIRLDLAGGWSDTPPYCIEYGGKVVNVAVDLNEQSPIQVFCKLSSDPTITIRSVDLGIETKIETYEEIKTYNGKVGCGFGLVKAALAISGFEPKFHVTGGYSTLKEQLIAEFDGGLEITTVCAIPKGSGLGTSSVLSATILGTLSKICGLHWDETDIIARTSTLEQMLTTGGGWQDQIGGLYHSIKLIETIPGIEQRPIIKWLPENMFSANNANHTILLYYTGITRIAKNILGEIVKNLFFNSTEHINIIKEIQNNAVFTADAVQRNDWECIVEGIRRSWILNQRLDVGTNTPDIQNIIDNISEHSAAYKLLGAGGGGYMMILADDFESGVKIREILNDNPPNERARFVDISLSKTGFQATTS